MDTLKKDLKIWGCDFFPTIGIKITHKCTMNCSFCCDRQSLYRTEYNYDTFREIIDILANAGSRRICFTGGEPLLYPDIEKVIIYAKNKGFETILLSSDGKHLDDLSIPNHYISSIRISLHGTLKMHDKIVGIDGAYDRIEKSLKNLHSQNYVISVATVVTPENVNNLRDIANFCVNNGIRRYYLFNLLQSGLGHEYILKNGRINNNQFDAQVLKLKNEFENLDIISHPYNSNAECIIVEGNGDILIDPYFKNSTFQKVVGNIFNENTNDIIERIAFDQNIWKDILNRFSRSTLTKPFF